MSIDDLKASLIKKFNAQLTQIQADEKILYIGARWKVMESIANQIFSFSSENEGEGYKKLNPHNHKIVMYGAISQITGDAQGK